MNVNRLLVFLILKSSLRRDSLHPLHNVDSFKDADKLNRCNSYSYSLQHRY